MAGLEIGFCHGDFHGGNACQKDGSFTFYDFDCCGWGYRAYDLAGSQQQSVIQIRHVQSILLTKRFQGPRCRGEQLLGVQWPRVAP
jgi:thiamine kinase-like enzyme